MQKTRKKLRSTALLCCLLPGMAFSQAKSGLENYNQFDQHNEYRWMPVLHYQSQKGMYAEFRYNYEEVNTATLFLGKSFEKTGRVSELSLTPMIGLSAGTFKGNSLGLNTEFSSGQFYVSSQMQYSRSFTAREKDFYFNWSETGYDISDKLFAGFAMQYCLQAGEHEFQPGFLAGLNIANFSIPLYLFRPFSNQRSIILGINYEYRLKRKKMNKDIYL